MAKIKEVKCPDCGSDAEFVKLLQYRYEGFLRCPNCGREGDLYSSKQNAVKAWNKVKRKCKEIKCTSCGGIAEFVELERGKSRSKGYIRCPSCGKEGRTYCEKYAAVKAWYREVVPQVMTLQELINKINYQCNVRDWDYAKLSWVSGVPLTTLMNIMNGNTKNPGIFTVMKLCKAFGITMDELLGGK